MKETRNELNDELKNELNDELKNELNDDFRDEIRILLKFFLGYAIFYLIPQLFEFPLNFKFWISELNQEVTFQSSMDVLLEIFFTGPLFGLLVLSVSNDIFKNNLLSSKAVSLLKNLVIFFVGIMILGNAVHEVANDLNGIAFAYSSNFSNPQYATLYYDIYWWDEFFGHMMMAIPLSVFLMIFSIGIFYRPINSSNTSNSDNVKNEKIINLIIWLFFSAIGVGYAIE